MRSTSRDSCRQSIVRSVIVHVEGSAATARGLVMEQIFRDVTGAFVNVEKGGGMDELDMSSRFVRMGR